MCLYIITQRTGAARYIARDERESVPLTQFMFSTPSPRFAHGTLRLKSILALFHSSQKPTADVSLFKKTSCILKKTNLPIGEKILIGEKNGEWVGSNCNWEIEILELV